MNQPPKTYFNWSSGKDAALAFYLLSKSTKYNIDKLVTTVNAHYQRVSMHGLPIEFLKKQSEAIGIPLEMIELPENPSMETYEQIMNKAMSQLKSKGYNYCGFGDIFLEDLKKYREQQMAIHEISCVFPLWKRDTKYLIKEFLQLGFKAIIVCLNSEKLDESFLGREIDESFIDDLPSDVDPCGENGEFHTFCYDGPIFKNPISFTQGERTYREYKISTKDDNETTKNRIGYWFLDLLTT